MAFLKISKNYSNILVEKFTFLNTPLSLSVSGLKILDLYLKDDESAAVTLFIFKLPWTSWSVWIIIAIINQIVHRHYNIKIISIINVFIVYVVMHFLNGAQFLNLNLVLASPTVAVMSPVTRIYASE